MICHLQNQTHQYAGDCRMVKSSVFNLMRFASIHQPNIELWRLSISNWRCLALACNGTYSNINSTKQSN